jgi:hypothetical protein
MGAAPIGGAPQADDIDPGGTTTRDIDLRTSVAGEVDPGASLDTMDRSPARSAGRSDPPAGQRGGQPAGGSTPMSPGDEAPVGTPGTAENVCPDCGGSGQKAGRVCPTCEGTGTVNVGIGGA